MTFLLFHLCDIRWFHLFTFSLLFMSTHVHLETFCTVLQMSFSMEGWVLCSQNFTCVYLWLSWTSFHWYLWMFGDLHDWKDQWQTLQTKGDIAAWSMMVAWRDILVTNNLWLAHFIHEAIILGLCSHGEGIVIINDNMIKKDMMRKTGSAWS